MSGSGRRLAGLVPHATRRKDVEHGFIARTGARHETLSLDYIYIVLMAPMVKAIQVSAGMVFQAREPLS